MSWADFYYLQNKVPQCKYNVLHWQYGMVPLLLMQSSLAFKGWLLVILRAFQGFGKYYMLAVTFCSSLISLLKSPFIQLYFWETGGRIPCEFWMFWYLSVLWIPNVQVARWCRSPLSPVAFMNYAFNSSLNFLILFFVIKRKRDLSCLSFSWTTNLRSFKSSLQ